MGQRAHDGGTVDVGSLAAVLEVLPDPVLVLDQEMRVVAMNRRAVAFVGRSPADFGDTPPVHVVHPDDLPLVLSSFEEVLGKDVGTPIEIRVRAADGGWRLVEVVGSTYHHADGLWQINTFRDLTERRRWEVAATQTERFRTIIESATVIVLLLDGDGRIESVSGAMTRQLGHDPTRLMGSCLTDWVTDADRARVEQEYAEAVRRAGVSVIECHLVHKDGSGVPYQLSITNRLDDPVAAGMIVAAHDISSRRDLEDRLAHLAAHDPLTGLANRAKLVEYLEAECADRDDDEPVGVVFVDLDRLKRVNDLYGHSAGDELLVAIAQRLRAHVRPRDLVARLGGDEFVIVCPGAEPSSTLPALAERLERAIADPVSVGGLTLSVDASVGYVTARAGMPAEVVLAEADDVMYQAKQARRGAPSGYRLGIVTQRGLVEDLRAALAGDPADAGLRLHFQAVVALPDGKLVGAEALVRWLHPRLGPLGPAHFLAVAEDSGLDVALGAWVLRGALEQLAEWDASLTMAVNLSTSQIVDSALEAVVSDTLRELELEPERLCLEVTERQMFGGPSRRRRPTATALRALRARGVSLAIDDFGTGFADLARLREYPADVLKIDRTFVTDVATDPTSAGICAAVVALAQSTLKTTVAVGVETEEQARVLADLGVDRAQGHFYGHPGPAAGFRL